MLYFSAIASHHKSVMIIHADMDAFYASVEIRERPDLLDKPVAVGGSPKGRGVISAANYIARQYGVHSAMPSVTAKKLCPQLILLPSRISYYAEISNAIHNIFSRYTPIIEPLSLDEAFLDVTFSQRLFGPAPSIGHLIQNDIHQELGLSVSIGVAPNKYLAKIASDLEKPHGFVVVRESNVQAFLDPLPITRIWGVGKVTSRKLHQLGIITIEDLRNQPLAVFRRLFDNQAEHMWELAHGRDQRAVCPTYKAKSLSHETTFETDISDTNILLSSLSYLCEQVARRLRNHEMYAKTINIKIRYDDFKTVLRSKTLPGASNQTIVLWETTKTLYLENFANAKKSIRLVGMGVSQLFDVPETHPQQGELFSNSSETDSNREIDQLTDTINQRFGKASLSSARSLPPKR